VAFFIINIIKKGWDTVMGSLKKIIAIIVTLAMILPYGTISFGQETDIANHWAKEEIQYLLSKGIVSGYGDGSFRPDKEITRAEFVKIVNGIFGYQELGQVNFTDVKETDWFYNEIAKAVKAGYISGYGDGTMRPNNLITRQEAAKIIGMVYDLEETESTDSFVDASQIGNWAIGYVNALREKGYISGYEDGTFRPNRPITRAEAVKIIVNASGSIINQEGEYTGFETGNVVVNTPDVTLKDMYISGDLYLAEGIGEGDVILDNVVVDGNTYIRGGGENSIIIINSSLNQVVVKKETRDVRVVFEGDTSVSIIVSGENTKIVVKEGVRVESIKVTGKTNIEVEKGAEVGTIEVESKDVEIKAEGNIGTLIAKEEVKVNDEVVEKDSEVKVEEGKVEVSIPEDKDEKDKKDEDDRPPAGGGGGGGGIYTPPRDDEDDEDEDDEEEVVPVNAISVEPDTLKLVLGDTGSLTVTFEPENVSYKKVIWSSSNEAVATVDANGNITAVGAGIATITATSAADSSKKDTCIVTVKEAGTIKKTAYCGTPDNVAYYFEFELTNGLKIGNLTSLVAKAYAGDTLLSTMSLNKKGFEDFANNTLLGGSFKNKLEEPKWWNHDGKFDGTMPTKIVIEYVKDGKTYTFGIEDIEWINEGYKPVSLKSGDTTKYFDTIQEAIDAAETEDTIILGGDIDLTNGLTISSDKEITLDLNGHIIAYEPDLEGTTALITNNGSLTIEDNSLKKTGKITNQALNPDTEWEHDFPAYANNTITNFGKLIIKGGRIENTTDGGASYAIDNNSTVRDAILIVNGGYIVNPNKNFAIRQFANSTTHENTVTIEDGVIEGTRAIWIQLPGTGGEEKLAELTVNGGTLKSTDKDGYNLAVYSYSFGDSFAKTKITINGGIFDGDVALTGGSCKIPMETVIVSDKAVFLGQRGVFSYAQIVNETQWKSYGTIQAAIGEANNGDTITVKNGEFEGFTISGKNDITIKGTGKGETFIQPTELLDTSTGHKYKSSMKSAIFVTESSNIVIQDLTVEDGSLSPDAIVFWNASSGEIKNVEIKGTSNLTGTQTGQGIAVDASENKTTNLKINDTVISGFNKNAIDIVDGNGNENSPGKITVEVSGGTITGAGETDVNCQNGIVFWDRGGGTISVTVSGVSFKNLYYTPEGNVSYAIMDYRARKEPLVTVTDCTFNNVEGEYYSREHQTENIIDTNVISEEDKKELEESDITQLKKAIQAAITVKEGIIVSVDGTDVPAGTYWVTQEDMDALDEAIAKAETARETAETQEDVDNAVAELEAAIAAFNDAKQKVIEAEKPVEGEEQTADEQEPEDNGDNKEEQVNPDEDSDSSIED